MARKIVYFEVLRILCERFDVVVFRFRNVSHQNLSTNNEVSLIYNLECIKNYPRFQKLK